MNDNTDLAVKLFVYFPLKKDSEFFGQNLRFSLKHIHAFIKKKKSEKSPNFHNLKKNSK